MRRLAPWILAFLGLAGPAAGAAFGEPFADGVVVREVRRGTTAERAGLQPGDLLLSFARAARPPADAQPPGGSLHSPFDLLDVFVEQLPRGGVTLAGRRGEREVSWLLPGGWPCDLQELRVVPGLSGDLAARLEAGEAGLAAGDLAAAAPLLEDLAARARERGDAENAGWLLSRLAAAYAVAGRWGDADAAFTRAVAPLERRQQGSTAAAHLLRQWGDTFRTRAGWQRADERYRRALAIDRKLAPQSLAAAESLTGRGLVASFTEGSVAAEDFYREALALRESLAPGSTAVAASWFDLFFHAHLRREEATAMAHLETAVALQEEATPGGLYAARKRTTLGINRLAAGDFASSRVHLERALAIARTLAPEDPDVPFMLQGLGMISFHLGDPAAAVDFLRQAAALAAKVFPGTYQEADILHDLGLAERRAGHLEESAGHLCRALDFPERRYRELAGNDEETSRLGVKFGNFYRDCAIALAGAGQARRAFDALERGRARALLNLLTERPPPSVAGPAAAERRLLEAEYDRVQAALAELDPVTQAQQVEGHIGRLREIYRRQEEILAEAVPKAGDVAGNPRLPGETLTLDDARRVLDPGTVLAAYVTGEEESWLFVVRPEKVRGKGFAAFRLAVGKAALDEKIASFRTLLQDGGSSQVLLARASELYDLLLRPAEPLLEGGDRLLISPDGPLHTLPFPALGRRGRFLIEWKPLHLVLSATTYGEIRRERRPLGDPRLASLVAFGDPDYRELAPAAEPPGEVLRRGLAPLPGTRREVRRIAALFSRARAYLGREATEERFKSLPQGVRYLHFAVHGLLDEQFPLNSALALSPPPVPGDGRDNGLLQVWEIARGRQLDADLVTLSACESALGRDKGGEGLLGLTRAFQYAGARSVLAALWSIPDEATTALMEDFYRRLRAGVSKDRALRTAQIARIRSSGGRPAAWAAFQLYGDWK